MSVEASKQSVTWPGKRPNIHVSPCDGQVGEVVRRLAELDEPGFAHILVKLVCAVQRSSKPASAAAFGCVPAFSTAISQQMQT